MQHVEECLSFLIGKAAQTVTRRTREALAPYRITPVQYAILKVLWDRDGQSGAELGARLMLDSATITGLLDRMENAGLIARRPDPAGDRRVNRAYLTDAGQALQVPLDAAMDAVNAAFRTELGDAQASDLWAALARIGQVRPPADL